MLPGGGMLRVRRSIAVLVGLTMLAAGAWAAPLGAIAVDSTATFIAEADAPVMEATPTVNAGTAALRVDGGSDPDVDSHIRFAVTGAMTYVLEATLRVFATTGTVDGPAVYATSGAWSEASITWNSRPALVGAALDDVQVVSSSTWVEYDVTTLVTGDGTFSIVLATTSTDGADFFSREGPSRLSSSSVRATRRRTPWHPRRRPT
jgi:hypothetical protein